MPVPLFILHVLLAVCAALTAAYWGVLAFHAQRSARKIPTAHRGLELARQNVSAGPPASVCIIVPAHNEASCIEHIARSALAQDHPETRAVFALDRCTDETRAILDRVIAEAPNGGRVRADVVEITSCPPECAGKPHGLWRAVQTSPLAHTADYLLFADADTTLDPACTRATLALLRARRLHMLSLLSSLTYQRWFERQVQPAAVIELVRQYPITRANARVDIPDGPDALASRPFANGQFILFERAAYERIGGHYSVRGSVLEDVELAQVAVRNGLRTGVFLAAGLMHCKMYTAWDEFCRGWKRIYSESANRRPARLRQSARRMRLVGTLMPAGSLAAIAVAAALGVPDPLGWLTLGLGVLALLTWLIALVMCHRLGNVPVSSVPWYPIGVWRVGSILNDAARDLEKGRPTVWAGREYHRQTR